MTGSRIMKKRILIALSLALILALGSVDILFAEEGHENGSMPALKQSSTLTIKTQFTDEEIVTPISGVLMTIYKVADLTVKDGMATYTPTEKFESVKINYKEMTASASNEAAQKLYELVKDGEITGETKESDGNGVINYGSVENGMYLVVQTGANGDATEYSQFAPYLISAPQPVPDNTWEYDVVSIPKSEVQADAIKLTKTVNNKDTEVIDDPQNKFSYIIKSELDYVPDQFAVVDKVPEQLEIVNTSRIEIKVNGQLLDKETKDAIVKIKGNTLRVEPTKEMIEQWSPFEMTVLFYCKFKNDIKITEENLDVTNVAGYEVNGDYKEPPGKENRAKVKGDTKKIEKNKNGNGTRTGDAFRYMTILTLIMLASVLTIVIVLKRRRKKAEQQE